jgi:predicted  nucleic acid-binding Zn-ribbon protein
MKKIIFILLFLFIAKVAFAQVYKWVDERGVTHFTEDITQIPEKFRPQMERVKSLEEGGVTIKENESSPQKDVKGTRPPKDDYRDSLGRGEEYWKGRVEEWNKKLNDAQEKLGGLRIKYNELTDKFNDSKSSVVRLNIRKERDQIQQEMETYKNQIEEAKQMLEKKIPEEAELFKAKPEWIRR